FPVGYDQSVLTPAAVALAGMYLGVVNTPFELNTPVYRGFFSAMAQSSPQIQPPKNMYAVDGWIAADLMIRGLQGAGDCPTREAFISALRKVDSYDAGGLLRPALNLAAFRQPNECLNLVKVNAAGGAFQPQGAGPVCGRIISSQ
ncbi:MAG: ABC transporter substrate-binding protein, partial [Frankia sp.]